MIFLLFPSCFFQNSFSHPAFLHSLRDMFTVEDCAKRLHSINGSLQCINSRDSNSARINLTDLTQWMEDNKKESRQIVDMIRDMVKSSRFSSSL